MNTTPEYTDEEILHSWNHRKYKPGQMFKTLDNLRAFLAALPSRQQASETEIAALKEELRQVRKHLEDANRGAELAALRQSTASAQPIQAADGRSLGQTFAEKYGLMWNLIDPKDQKRTEEAANAVVTAARPAIEDEAIAAAVRRMEAVPKSELWFTGFDAIRARLIQAVKEGQPVVANEQPNVEETAKPDTFYAHGYTWTRHTPGDPMPCDGGRKVFCLSDHPDCYKGVMEAKSWCWGIEEISIIGWRYADEPAQSQPWTPKTGDVVQIKSGGPKMTVTRVDGNTITCVWFNQSQNERTACFAVELLQQA